MHAHRIRVHRQKIHRLRVPGIAHVGDHDAAAHACTNVCMAACNHDLHAVAAPALVGVAEEFNVPRALGDNHCLLPSLISRQFKAGEEEMTMPTYVMLANWTDQGMRSIGDSPKRVDIAKKTLEEMGGQFRSVYMTMGQYDLVMIYDAPDDAVAARFTLMLGKLGNVRTTSLKAFPEEAFRQIVNSLR